MLIDFDEYADRLRAVIEDPESRMLLKASQYAKSGEHVAFQLTSNAFLTEFITIWELFDQRKDFDEFIKMFAKKARHIHQENPYTAIVTSTATSKHILEHAHASIESGRDKVSVYYLGDYPFLDTENRNLLDFKGENVLIVSDVIATGRLVGKMAEIVEEVGGRPIGVLCAVLIGPDLIARPVIEFGQRKPGDPAKYLRIHSMATRAVEPLRETGVGQAAMPPPRILKIDPVTILPEDDLLLPRNGFYPRFTESEMFAHFESAEALDFDFYTMDARRLTTAIRVQPLLEKYGEPIWRAIEPKVRDGETLVTTFQRDDVLFKEFVEDKLLSRHSSFVFIPKRNSLETPNSYFLLPTQLEKIAGKRIVLLLSAVYTAERLRNLASLLVSNGAESITVICLLNRMGIYTSSFISRLERMVRGVGKNNDGTSDHTLFEFFFLYSLPDISGDDLNRMQETIRALFDYYTTQTRVPSFRRSMQQDFKYFQARSMTSHHFERPQSHSLSTPFSLAIDDDGPAITVRSREGRLALLCGHLVAKRDFGPFIHAIRDRALRDKETLYKIFGILLSDLSYLKVTGRFAALRETLIAEIRALRSERFSFEGAISNPDESAEAKHIELPIDTETHLLFGLAIFSYLDYEFDYEPLILEMLTCGFSIDEWALLPRNFIFYFADERIAWCLSVLMHFSRHDFRQPTVAKEFKHNLEREVDLLLKGLDRILSGDEAKMSTTNRQRVKANLNLLLTELGVHDLTEKHQVIRFLHSKIIALKRGHNPIHSSLETALLAIQKALASHLPSSIEDTISSKRRIPVKSKNTKKALEDATYTAGILEEIAEAVRQMMVFTPASRENGGRYAAEPGLPGFTEDVKRLGDVFQKIRVDNQVSKLDLQELTRLRNRIAYDFWDPNSHLRQHLFRYIVPLREWTDNALESANETLRSLGFGEVWNVERKKLEAWPLGWKVLMDRHLLREVLRNIFSNVRHAFDGYQLASEETYADLVRLEIAKVKRPAPDLKSEERDYFELTVVSRGSGFHALREDTTFELHQREVANFAGRLHIQPFADQQGAEVTLTLLSRPEPPKETIPQEADREEDLL